MCIYITLWATDANTRLAHALTQRVSPSNQTFTWDQRFATENLTAGKHYSNKADSGEVIFLFLCCKYKHVYNISIYQ